MTTTKTRTMKWKLIEAVLTCTHLDDKDRIDKFDLSLIFPDFMQFDKVQMYISEYGVKQRLADRCARPADMKLTAKERTSEMKELWELWMTGEVKTESSDRKAGIKASTLLEQYNAATKANKKVFQNAFGDELRKLGIKF